MRSGTQSKQSGGGTTVTVPSPQVQASAHAILYSYCTSLILKRTVWILVFIKPGLEIKLLAVRLPTWFD